MSAVAHGGKRLRAHRITAVRLLACVALGPSAASQADKSWSAVPSDRYEVLGTFNDAAFLDKDTGL